jgi:transposase-like protein
MPGRVFSVEFKRSVVGELERKEKSIAQICQEHRLAESQVHKWRKLFGSENGEREKVRDMEDQGKAAIEAEVQSLHRKVAELERLCGQMALENAYPKNSLATYLG